MGWFSRGRSAAPAPALTPKSQEFMEREVLIDLEIYRSTLLSASMEGLGSSCPR